MSFRERFKGSQVPTVTPFVDGAIDMDSFRSHVDWLFEMGSPGVVVCGTTGEPEAVAAEERLELVKAAVDVSAGRGTVLAGTGRNRLDETISLSRAASEAGADGVIVITPSFVLPSQDGLIAWYQAIAKELEDQPVLIYDNPRRTAVRMEPSSLGRLREVAPNIAGIKLSVPDVDQVTEIREAVGPDADFALLAGFEHYTFSMCLLGATGSVSASGNLLPAETQRLHDLIDAGEITQARALHESIRWANLLVLKAKQHPVPVKHALHRLRGISGEVRPPLSAPDEATRQLVDDALAAWAEEASR